MSTRKRFPARPAPVRVPTADIEVAVEPAGEFPDEKAEKLDELDTHRRAEILPDGTRRWRFR